MNQMAQAGHLPIYKAGYDLCVYLEDVVRRFSRYHKYGLGTEHRGRAGGAAAGRAREHTAGQGAGPRSGPRAALPG